MQAVTDAAVSSDVSPICLEKVGFHLDSRGSNDHMGDVAAGNKQDCGDVLGNREDHGDVVANQQDQEAIPTT